MKTYLVGGAVRDKLLGLKVEDRDWLVVDGSSQEMLDKGFIQVGKRFPVFLHPETYEEYALARTEIKVDKGYQGFTFNTEDVRLVDDLKRRDLTINAMAIDEDGLLHDPFRGKKDIESRTLRHVSNAFCEDPLRVLRVARFAAKFHYLGFTIAPATQTLMRTIVANNELERLSSERIYQEFIKAFSTPNPEIFIQTLQNTGVFKHIVSPLAKLSYKDLSHIIHAKTQNCQQTDILFALLLFPLANEVLISKVLSQLRTPKVTQILCLETYRYHHFFSNIYAFSEQEILRTLKAANALRNTQSFDLLIYTFQYIYHEHPQALASITLSQNIVRALKEYNYIAEIKDLKNKKTIAKVVEKTQLTIIQQAIEKT
ncbi:multifunctional CCA tRNA nucleotidyl transferase/2'3'-cyclic phosphodiesterase/2'nucleotidase/phosphatase [Fastidiosibacter lacustris]|uniref:multifunctional CCA tRNA nucleotidyl transferase/2'3'-cyclic phosphodiesterase/2'nucleotidase/phosphatase n=1 Tax=Fastidiosibacter lacustris TaxID=2056695 RepID=UPI000E3448E0|nr:multifunctional CCA tRNA nucleotidyl transferase/2'3'-cyclic phosphodiesterase/2'nucleotidase/phosphatase [Fastidiosibacter lacustris]